MKIYRVGGCVRDTLLFRNPKDIDYVVVGSTPEQMMELGYQQVGKDFPVFLKDGEEYALARTERKTGTGYHGFTTNFDPTVTLIEDLRRRDLTINAMAQDMDTGEIIDPYGGQQDLEQHILRHTSEAFAEDPVRVLRTARFAARYGFNVADETMELMKQIVGELVYVSPERIWLEFEKGMAENNPIHMITVLQKCGAFKVKPLIPYSNPAWTMVLPGELPLSTRFIMLARGFSKQDYIDCRIPSDLAQLSSLFNQYYDMLWDYPFRSPAERLDMLIKCNALHYPWVISKLLNAAQSWVDRETLKCTITSICKDIDRLIVLDLKAVVDQDPKRAKELVLNARLQAIQN